MTPDEMKRIAIVIDLLGFARPLEEIATQLAAMGWDYEGDGVELTRQHLSAVLRRFAAAVLPAKDVEAWANLIEGREDVCFEAGCERQIEEVLYELANPMLTQPLDTGRANSLIETLT